MQIASKSVVMSEAVFRDSQIGRGPHCSRRVGHARSEVNSALALGCDSATTCIEEVKWEALLAFIMLAREYRGTPAQSLTPNYVRSQCQRHCPFLSQPREPTQLLGENHLPMHIPPRGGVSKGRAVSTLWPCRL